MHQFGHGRCHAPVRPRTTDRAQEAVPATSQEPPPRSSHRIDEFGDLERALEQPRRRRALARAVWAGDHDDERGRSSPKRDQFFMSEVSRVGHGRQDVVETEREILADDLGRG